MPRGSLLVSRPPEKTPGLAKGKRKSSEQLPEPENCPEAASWFRHPRKKHPLQRRHHQHLFEQTSTGHSNSCGRAPGAITSDLATGLVTGSSDMAPTTGCVGLLCFSFGRMRRFPQKGRARTPSIGQGAKVAIDQRKAWICFRTARSRMGPGASTRYRL